MLYHSMVVDGMLWYVTLHMFMCGVECYGMPHRLDVRQPPAGMGAGAAAGYQGFQGHGLSILRIRYLVPRMCVVWYVVA